MDTTLQSIIEIALQQGIWAALYIYLFFRMLKENAERETQYQQMINHLSTNVVEGIADINDKLDDMARRLDNPSADIQPTHWPSGIAGWPFFVVMRKERNMTPIENAWRYGQVSTPCTARTLST